MKRLLQFALIVAALCAASSAQAACSTPCLQSQVHSALGGGGGALTLTLTASTNFTSGGTVLWQFGANSATVPSVTDTAGGTEHILGTSCATGCTVTGIASTYFIYGYTSGASGAGAIKFTQSSAFSMSGGFFEVTTGWTLDGTTYNYADSLIAATTVSVATNGATNGKDYLASFAIDMFGNGTGTPAITTFTTHDTDGLYPETDADFTQSSSGSQTAAWTGFAATARPAACIFALLPPSTNCKSCDLS